MKTVTLSTRIQITIPKDIREDFHLRPGSRLVVLEHEGMIRLVPVESADALFGMAKGIDTTVDRDEDRV